MKVSRRRLPRQGVMGIVLVTALMLVWGGSGEVQAANLIVNGSFETPNVGGGFGLFPPGGVPGWTGTNPGFGNQMEIDFTPILSPGVGTPAFDGNQSTEVDDFIQGISQTVTGLTPGDQYTLSWAYGLRPGAGLQALDVFFGGNLVTHDSGTAGPIGTPLIWIPNSFTVTATAATETLSFVEVTTGLSTTGNEIDAVSLTGVVPEPSTLLLLTTGLAGILGYGWRRKKRSA